MIIRTDKDLSNGYVELDAITYTGTQYIDTGFIPSYINGFKIEIEFALGAQGNRVCLLSNYNTSNNLSLEVTAANNARIYLNGGTPDVTVGTCTTNRNKVIYEVYGTDYSIDCNGIKTTGTFTNPGVVSGASMYLFVDRIFRYSTFKKLTIYTCKIWDGNTLVKSFIPTKRISDNAVGMTDLVNNVFYENKGTGSFTGGNEISGHKFKIRRNLLPIAYQRVNYIESDGTQYINTGVKPTSSTKLSITFSYESAGQTAWIPLYGTRGSSSSTYFALFINATSLKVSPNYAGFDPGNNSQVVLTAHQKYNIWADGGQFYLDGSLESSCSTTNTLTTPNTNIYLFAISTVTSSGLDSRQLHAKLYGCRLYEGNTLLRDFIPCYRKSDSVYGLYDLVNNQFYTSATEYGFTGSDKFDEVFRVAHMGYRNSPAPGFDISLYKRVANLGNTNGSQFLEIPFIPDWSKGFKFEFGFIPTVSGQRYTFMSNYNIGASQLSLEIAADNKIRFWMNSGNKDVKSTNTYTVNQLNTAVFEFKSGVYDMVLNGTHSSGEYACTAKSGSTSMYIYLDKAKRTSTFPKPIKFTYVKIWENDELKFNLIPCVTKNGNTYGMYDCINGVFYSNGGTGSFTVGDEIPLEIL